MLFEIVPGRFRVCAILEERNCKLECATFDFLKSQMATADASVRGMKALFERYGDGGRVKLTTDLLHHANAELEIYEFIKGQLRVFCFFDGETVILTHGALKKSKKADQSEVQESVRCRNSYNQWKKKGHHGR